MDYYDLKGKQILVSQKIFLVDSGKLLILKNHDDAADVFEVRTTTWSVPGGLLEIDEDFNKGLRREVLEETGLEVEVGKIFSVRDFSFDNFIFKDGSHSPVRFIELGFTGKYSGGEIELSEEHSEYRWVDMEELKNYNFSPDVSSLAEDYLKLNQS